MESIVNYITSWLVTTTDKKETIETQSYDKTKEDIVYLIDVSDLLKVKLKPLKDTIPSPARNMPHISKFELSMLNQAQLKSILNVKLKPVKKPDKPNSFVPRHPVLQELLQVRPIIY